MLVRLRFKSRSLRATNVVEFRPTAPPTAAPAEPGVVTNEEIAAGLAALLSPVAAVFFTIACWRLGQDLGVASNFFIVDGPFSHWQVWLTLAGLIFGASGLLNRMARKDDDTPATS
jgi:hypothetical protein